MKEDSIKYTVCTEGHDGNFHYLRVMLISLLKHNSWANGDIIIFTCNETPLSRHNRTILESICKNIKFHDIDLNIYSSLNIKSSIRKNMLPLLYKIEAFNLTENDAVLYVNSSSLCISSLDFVFSGKSEVMVANTGHVSLDKGSPDRRKFKVDEFNTSLLLLSKSVLSENISSHILNRLSRIKNLTFEIIEKEIKNSLKIRRIEIGYFDLNRVIKKSRYTDSKYTTFLSIKQKVGLIHLDINFSRKNDSTRLMYRKIDAIWQSYNQQGEWNSKTTKDVKGYVSSYLQRVASNKPKSPLASSAKLLKYISGKQVCIVGPSACLNGSEMGKLIDSYDIVVRFNGSLPIPASNINDYGSKTNILYINNFFVKKMGSKIISKLKLHTKYIVSKSNFPGTIHVNPSSLKGTRLMGNIAVSDILTYNPSKIFITGIDFYKNANNFKSTYHDPKFFGRNFNPKPSTAHNFKFNMDDLKTMHLAHPSVIELDKTLQTILYEK